MRADYQVEVRLFRYWNPEHRRSGGNCCDGGGECGNNVSDFCDSHIQICLVDATLTLTPLGETEGCVAGDVARVIDNDDDLMFEEGADTLQGLPNPVVLNVSGPWPVSGGSLVC